MTKQYSNSTDIKVSQTDDLSSSFISHNSRDNNNNDAEGVGYHCSIGREPTQKDITKDVPIERERQKIVKINYPLIVPGVDEPCEECSDVIGAYRCDDCNTTELKVNHCQEWSCRVCGMRKIRRQSKNIVRRMYAFKRVLGTSANPRHFVISSKKMENMDIYQITKFMNNLFARYLPDISGVYVIHPFRIRGWDNVKSAGSKARYNSDANIKRRLREYRDGDKPSWIQSDEDKPIEENLSSGGFWELIKDDVLELGSWRKYCYVSPHVHVIGWGRLPNADEFYQMTKGQIIYKMIDTKGIGRSFEFSQSNSGFEFSSEVLRTLNYLGSHAAIHSNDDTYVCENGGGRQDVRRYPNRVFRSFGLCSTKAFKMDIVEGQKIIWNGASGDECSTNGYSEVHEIKCPTCKNKEHLKIVSKSKWIRQDDGHRELVHADVEKPFDEFYNPLDSEGYVISCLINPLKFFEWRWFKFSFVSDYIPEARQFAKSLPKPKIKEIMKSEIQKIETETLTKKINLLVMDYDRLSASNTNDGVWIE